MGSCVVYLVLLVCGCVCVLCFVFVRLFIVFVLSIMYGWFVSPLLLFVFGVFGLFLFVCCCFVCVMLCFSFFFRYSSHSLFL